MLDREADSSILKLHSVLILRRVKGVCSDLVAFSFVLELLQHRLLIVSQQLLFLRDLLTLLLLLKHLGRGWYLEEIDHEEVD